MLRDAPRAPRDLPRQENAFEPVRRQHHVRGFGGCGRAARAHRDADVGQSERRRVVDPVPDHRRNALGAHGLRDLDLLLGRSLREDLIDSDDVTNELGDVGMVARHHVDSPDACGAEGAQGARSFWTDGIFQEEHTRERTIDRHVGAGRSFDGSALLDHA